MIEPIRALFVFLKSSRAWLGSTLRRAFLPGCIVSISGDTPAEDGHGYRLGGRRRGPGPDRRHRRRCDRPRAAPAARGPGSGAL
ncbi:protein of unknown function [Stenotrophomonas maltophilia]|nr:protein of unknown function [Stenotrophomonas maltophilia]